MTATTISKSELMSEAHRIAKKMVGDYQARLALALKKVWAQIKNREEKQVKTIQVNRVGGYSEEYKVLETETIELEDREIELPAKVQSDNRNAVIEYSAWEKYGKQRIYVDITAGGKTHQVGHFGIGEDNSLTGAPSKISWLAVEIWKNREVK